jgi:arylamine N-acetyltransferase
MAEPEQALTPQQRDRVLQHLGCTAMRPGVAALNRLITAYISRVPWESAFRIAKRSLTTSTDQCPRWPEEFWEDAIVRGGGGTCFESNYAFLSLLRSLGYDGYLTINNMGDTVGCHTAIIVRIDGTTRVVDVGIPLHRSILLRAKRVSRQHTPFHTYVLRPDGERRFQVERTRHPKRNIFTLLDVPVEDAAYRRATTNDYGPQGLFLERVVINKIIGKQHMRFSSSERPWCIEQFNLRGEKSEVALADDTAAAQLAAVFEMDRDVIQRALTVVANNVPGTCG